MLSGTVFTTVKTKGKKSTLKMGFPIDGLSRKFRGMKVECQER